MKINIGDQEVEIELIKKNQNHLYFIFEDKEYQIDLKQKSGNTVDLSVNGKSISVFSCNFENKGFKQVFAKGCEEYIKIHPKALGKASKGPAEGSLESPMPGKIFKVLKKVGDTVKSGEAILILEAMKMEHSIKATKDGVLKEIFFKEGEQVTGGAELCAIE